MNTASLSTPRAILFDWDNTLVDTWPVIHRALHDTYIGYGMTPWTLAEVKERVAQSMRESFPAIFGERWEEAAKAYQANYRRYQAELTPLEGSALLLETLARVPGLFVGIVSNKRGENLRRELGMLAWETHFAVAVGSEDAPFDKPHRAPVELALKDSSIAIGPDVWFVGDSTVDLQCAEGAGMTGILYGDVESRCGEDRSGRYRDTPFHAHVRDHAEMLALLRESGVAVG